MSPELGHEKPLAESIGLSPLGASGSLMEVNPDTPRQNHLLGALPAEEWDRLRPNMELSPMPLGHVLYESGDELRHVYFPTTSIVSLLYVMEDGSSAEIAIVGNEGIVGVSLFMGEKRPPAAPSCRARGTPTAWRASV